MRNVRSRIARWTGLRARAEGQSSRPGVETLERRCLLSVSASDARPAVETITQAPASAMTLTEDDTGYSRSEFDATGTFTGEFTLRRKDSEGRRTYVLTLDIESQDEFGNIDGTFSGTNFGTATFRNGVINNTKRGSRGWVRNLDMRYIEGDPGSTGLVNEGRDVVFDGHFVPGNDDQVAGVLREPSSRGLTRGRNLGKAVLNRTSTPDPTNEAPVAVDDTVTTDVDEPLRMTQARLLGNDTDANADDTLSITGVSDATNGTVEINADGTITFTPTAGFTGDATFVYTVSDGEDTDQGLVTVTVTANDANAPVAGDDVELTTEEDTALVVDTETLLANASDPNDTTDPANDTLNVTDVFNVTNGTAVFSDNGTATDFTDDTITFTPAAGFTGIASFDFTVSDTATPTQVALTDIGHAFITVSADGGGGGGGNGEAPVAVADTFDTDVNEPLRLTQAALLGNDSDADGDTLTITDVSGAVNGTVTLDPDDGTITFDPADDFVTIAGEPEATFTYTVSDGTNTTEGTVTITVNANDPNAPVAGVDEVTTDENTPLDIPQATLLANDTDPNATDTLTITAVDEATNGSVVLNSDGTITFTPADDFDGIASFSYTLSDGTLTDEGHVYVTVNDDGGNGGNGEAPVAGDDTVTTDVNEPLRLTQAALLGNDRDADGDTLTITDVSGAVNGTVTLDPDDGTITFDPADDFVTVAGEPEATFTYTVSDGTNTTEGTVTVTVNANDADAPNAGPDVELTTTEGTALVIDTDTLRDNGSDPTADVIRVTGVSNPTNGTVVFDDNDTIDDFSDDTITFTPTAGFTGIASFDYTLSDGTLDDTGHVFITVSADTDPPAGGGVDGGGSTTNSVVGDASLVGTYEGTLRLTARSTDANATGRNREIAISIARHTVDGALRGSIEVFGLLFDENGDGVIDPIADDADRDGNGDLNFTGFVSDDRFALTLTGLGSTGGGVINGTVRPDHHLFGSLLFEAGTVVADGDFDAPRVSTTPGDPNPPLVDPNDPVGPDPDEPNLPGNPDLPPGGGPSDPDAEPGPVVGGGDDGGTDDDGGDGGDGGGGDDNGGVVGPGSSDEGPGSADEGPGSAGDDDGIGDDTSPVDGIGGGGSDPDDDDLVDTGTEVEISSVQTNDGKGASRFSNILIGTSILDDSEDD